MTAIKARKSCLHLCEMHEVLETGIEVGFFAEGADAPEV